MGANRNVLQLRPAVVFYGKRGRVQIVTGRYDREQEHRHASERNDYLEQAPAPPIPPRPQDNSQRGQQEPGEIKYQFHKSLDST